MWLAVHGFHEIVFCPPDKMTTEKHYELHHPADSDLEQTQQNRTLLANQNSR